jgi:glycosyltransferase involved in cell wall biosynthesis
MSRKLNFLHLTTFYPPYSFGGDAIQLYRLAHALGDEGHHVDVIHCVDSYHLLHPGAPPAGYAEHPNVTRHELRSGFKSVSPLLAQQSGRTWLKTKAIREVLDARSYDVIHFHNISLLGPDVLAIEPARGKAVKVYTTHEHWLVCPMHVLWKFDKGPCDKQDCLRCTLHAKRPPQLWRYTGLLESRTKLVDQYIAPSRFVAGMHGDRGFAQPFVHLPNFIDREDQDWQTPEARPQPAPYFLFVGRLERIKGLQVLIDLWQRAKPEFDLLVVGEGTYEAELRRMAQGNPRIKFLGFLPQRKLGALYFHAIACLVPSITYETFGMTSVEAFARKTPAIVHHLGALPEVVEDSGGGLTYRTGEELLAAMNRLAASPELRAELGQKGYDGFLKWWCRDAHLSAYFDILNRVGQSKFGEIPWAGETNFPERIRNLREIDAAVGAEAPAAFSAATPRRADVG